MWFRCQKAGCFDERDEEEEQGAGERGSEVDDYLQEEAERDFVLAW